jgi:hypothetical protein
MYPVTLTGLGDRAHLAHPGVDLETRISPPWWVCSMHVLRTG